MERSKAILARQVCPREDAPGARPPRGHGKGPPDRRQRDLLEALDEIYEAFVVDNEQLSDFQERAARNAERFLRPLWREHRKAARGAPGRLMPLIPPTARKEVHGAPRSAPS
jgi:hypothetical protein